MKLIRLYFFLSAGLFLAMPGFSQSMSNTDHTITLTNTCINAGVSNGTYTLVLNYYDQDLSSSSPKTFPGVNVNISGGVMTITAPGGSFPTPATNSGWSLPDAWPGSIQLTSGSFNAYMTFFLNSDGVTDGFNCIPLPIWFNSFTGTQSGSTVLLHWQTAMEQNTSVIEIYRSSTGANFYKIGQVTAAGNSSVPVNYSFTDPNPDASDYYYLKMVSSVGLAGIYSTTIHVTCSGCHYTPPTPVNCSYTINGPDHVCNIENPTVYTLSSAVPNYNSITWSVDQPAVASLRTYPQYDRGKVTLLKKNPAGAVVLTATLSGCSNSISRVIAMGTPWPNPSYDYECDYLSMSLNNTPGATSINWIFTDATSGVTTENDDAGPTNYWQITNADTYYVSAYYTNACGTSGQVNAGGFQCDNACDGCLPVNSVGFAVSPNPSRGIVSIGMAASPVTAPVRKTTTTGVTTNIATTPVVHPKIYQVRVIDVKGVVRKTFNYPGGMQQLSLDLSSLSNGVYIIQIFDNKTWRSTKVILAK